MSHSQHVQNRQDKFYKLAKDQGYRSRAAYKLIQLNKKFSFLGNARAAIDLCAAPGGWLQVLSKNMPVSSMIIGVDILPIKPLPNVITFVEDITTQSCRAQLKKQLQGWQVDLVVHDGAPNVGGGGSWTKDAYVQNELVLHSLKLACEFLVEGGNFVTKIFRSPEYTAISWTLKQFFKKVEISKPVASRSQSSEVFAICKGYLAPSKIDPRIFDPAYVFQLLEQDSASSNKVVNVLRMDKAKKPNRQGYSDDVGMVMHKTATISQFLNNANPHEVLANANQLIFDPDSEYARQSILTTPDLVLLFDDLKVLGKGDFTQLIKWHKKMRIYKKELDELSKIDNDDDDDNDDQGDDELTEEQIRAQQDLQTEAEIEALQERLRQRKRRLQKKDHERKMKEIKRLALNANNLAEHDGTYMDNLFTLASIKNDTQLQLLRNNDSIMDIIGIDKFNKIIASSPDDIHDISSDDDDNDNSDDDMADLDYAQQREKIIEQMYSRYKEQKGIQTKKDIKKIRGQSADGGQSIIDHDLDDFTDGDDDDNEQDSTLSSGSLHAAKQYLQDTHSTNTLHKKAKKETDVDMASRWFSQGIFNDIDVDNTAEHKMYMDSIKDQYKQKKEQQAIDEIEYNKKIATTKRKRAIEPVDESDEDNDDAEHVPTTRRNRLASVASALTAPKNGTTTTKRSRSNDQDVNIYASTYDGDDADDDYNGYNSDDAVSDSDSDDDEDERRNQHKTSRWLGSAEDKERERLNKQRMLQKAQDYANKMKAMDSADVQVVELSEYSDDSDARAEILALGTKMLRKKTRNEIIDASYNKYTYNDRDDLPDWFAEDEARHNVPNMPITKAEVDLMKQQMKAIDSRPISKIAEAKARKKKGALRKLERQKLKVDQIMNAPDLSAAEKAKQVEKLNAASRKKLKDNIVKTYVVSGKNGQTRDARRKDKSKKGGKPFTVRVDGRMKADKKGAKRAEWRKSHRRSH